MLFSIFLLTLCSTCIAASGSKGCGTRSLVTPGSGVFFHITIAAAGGERRFKVNVPANYNIKTPAPLIFSFHGRGKTSEQQESLSGFSETKFNTDAIAVYPQGLSNQWQGDPMAPASVSDIAFTQSMISNLTSTFCIDETRIYASGKSNGGGFVNQIACSSLASKFAAFAPVSGAYYIDSTSNCDAEFGRRPTPMIVFHGDADTTIPYEGGNVGRNDLTKAGLLKREPEVYSKHAVWDDNNLEDDTEEIRFARSYIPPRPAGTLSRRAPGDLPPIPTFLAQWAARNQCSPSYSDNLFSDEVTRTKWDCQGNTGILTHYRTHNWGHWWPSKDGSGDNPSRSSNYDATTVIMTFFKRYTL